MKPNSAPRERAGSESPTLLDGPVGDLRHRFPGKGRQLRLGHLWEPLHYPSVHLGNGALPVHHQQGLGYVGLHALDALEG